jgi:hypothetical protein
MDPISRPKVRTSLEMSFVEQGAAIAAAPESNVKTLSEIAFSVGLIPAAAVSAAIIGWLALRVSLYFLVLLAIPMALITMSCLGARGLRSPA